MAFSAALRNQPVASINITPLVDVMLVLLIIFMVSAPMLARPLDAQLPQPNPLPSPHVPSLLLEIAADGNYRLDSRPMQRPELENRLQEAAISDPNTALSVQANDDLDYQTLVTALAIVHDSGIVTIGIRP
ncbi:MAG TPA: biopolymer transporter ExbD [Pseudoxanthomonas sp.]|nr:biopolymer transporter ExbD [Pseudoxanthomonas sp.]